MSCGKIVGYVVLGGLIVLGASSATAAPKKAGAKAMKKQDAALINQLKPIIQSLQQADHDYKGHRVDAIKEIHRAIHALRKEINPPVGTTKPKTTTVKLPQGAKTTPVKPATPEPQAVSDARLRQAAKNLTTMLGQINGLTATVARTQAADHVQNAINELKTALEVAPKPAAKEE